MGNIAIVTDSTAHLDPDVAKELDITVVPMNIHIGEQVLRDNVDIARDAVFQHMELDHSKVRVTPPTVEQFQQVYSQIHAHTDQVLSLHVSNHLSPVTANARRGAEDLLGRCQITILDSLSSSLGLGILATSAARLAQEGATLDEVVRLVRGTIPHIYMVFYTNDLDYLERNQHLSKPHALLGTMLKIKPVLFVEDGRIMPLEKVRTYERAHEKLLEYVSEFADVKQAAILQRQLMSTTASKSLQNRLQQLVPDVKFPVTQYEPVLASHIGPSAIGIVIYEAADW